MDGKILSHAKFVKVGPNVFAASATIMSHLLLQNICHRLERIQSDTSLIQAMLKNGLDAEAQGAIMMFRHVKTLSEAQFKTAGLANCATTLYPTILALIERLKLEINSVPDPENGFFDDILWPKSKAKATIASLKIAEMTLALIVECIRTLGEIHFVVGNNAAGVNAVEELFKRMLEAGIDEAAWKARRIPPRKEKSWPELTWTDFKSKVPLILDSLGSLKRRIQNSETVSIEFDVIGARLEQIVCKS